MTTYRNLVVSPPDNAQTTGLASWKAHMIEMHDTIVASGWVQTGDTGQIDLSAVGVVPVKDSYPGFRVYEINDDFSAAGYKIYMRVDFGSYTETNQTNYHNGATPSVKLSFGMKTDGAGVLLSQTLGTLTPAPTIRHPASASGASNTVSFSRPVSCYTYWCRNNTYGFFGMVFYCNGRGAATSSIVAYNASSLTFMVQRTLDSAGAVTNQGFTVYTTFSTNGGRWPATPTGGTGLNYTIGYSYTSNAIQATAYGQARPGGIDGAPVGGKIQVGPCYTYSNADLRFNPNMVTYRSQDLNEGAEFQVEVAPGDVRNFIALGPGSGLSPDTLGNQNSFAMLFE